MIREKEFNIWKKVSGILFLLQITGFIISFAFPEVEALGVLLVLLGYFGGLLVSSKVGFDDRAKWMGLTFLFPYILLLVMYFRKFENAVQSKQSAENKRWNRALSELHQKLQKIVMLNKKSTMSSIMHAGRLSNEIIADTNSWQPLSALVLDKNIKAAIRKKGAEMLLGIKDNDIVEEIVERLRKDPLLKEFIEEREHLD